MGNFMELDMKKISDPKALTFGVWAVKPNLGPFGPKTFGKGLTKPLVENPSSQTGPHFFPESSDECNKIVKSQKMS